MKQQPWMKFYPADWRADPKLRMCSIAARGLWVEMLALMHEAEPYGHLSVAGVVPDARQLAALVGAPVKEVKAAMDELEAAGVFSRTDNGTVYSRRMVRDRERAERDKANGRKGGNPNVKGGVNPPVDGQDKAHMPEARDNVTSFANAQEVTPPPSAARPDLSDAKTQLYDRGRQVLGARSGGVITDLLAAKGGSIAQARAALETASERADPREYIQAIIRKKPPPTDRPRTSVAI